LDAVGVLAANQPRRVVFVTAGGADIDDAQLARASESLLQLAASGAAWQIVRVLPTDGAFRWSDLARQAQGSSQSITSADELCAALVEGLTGQSRVVAHGVALHVTFNPKLVTSYRLLGHESATLTGASGDPLEVDLVAGQTATGMFELWLKPAAEGEIARVEVTWRDLGGQPRRMQRVVARSEVASSFTAAPPWLQQGIVTASAAELLRASYYVPRSRRLDQLLELVGEMNESAAKMPEFQALVRLIETAGGLR
jgi:Ca-activated chloride channel family protein